VVGFKDHVIPLASSVFLCKVIVCSSKAVRIVVMSIGFEKDDTMVMVVSFIHEGRRCSGKFFRNASRVKRYENVLLVMEEYIFSFSFSLRA
jgi:hypothetical protein